MFLEQNVPIDYNALPEDPDYLVIGPQSTLWKRYDAELNNGAFRPLDVYSRCAMLERVR